MTKIEVFEIAVILLLSLSLFLFTWVNILKKKVRENESHINRLVLTIGLLRKGYSFSSDSIRYFNFRDYNGVLQRHKSLAYCLKREELKSHYLQEPAINPRPLFASSSVDHNNEV